MIDIIDSRFNKDRYINSNFSTQYFNESFCLLNNCLKSLTNDSFSLNNVYPINFLDTKSNNEYVEYKDIFCKLGQLYENSIPEKIRKDYGQFYTSDINVINLMFSDKDLLSGKILEPSCGSGNFVLAIVCRLIKLLQNKQMSCIEILKYVQKNIYANDIDKTALKITELKLLALLLPLIAESLKNDQNFKLEKFKLSNFDFVRKNIFEEKFNFIIGNPPFVTMYGKRSRNMTEEKRSYFNTFDFVQNKSGNNKFNISMFFIENSLKLLKAGGTLSFVLDITFFETAFIDLRKYLINNFNIESITKGLKSFSDVASGQILLRISNSFSEENIVTFSDINKNEKVFVPQKLWNNQNNKYKIFAPLTSFSKSIVQKVMNYPKLDYYFPKKSLRTCCALTGKTDEFIVDPNKENKNMVFPYIEGSSGLKDKFGIITAKRYIKYDYDLQIKISNQFKEELTLKGVKNKKRVTLGDKDAYLAPKIFIRQSSNEIIATYTEKPFSANNSIYILSNKSYLEKDKRLLKYTCGLLNSKLITFYCKITKIIRAENGKTPQIKIADLKEIRINIYNEYFDDVVKLVEKLLLDPANVTFKEDLDKKVFEIYSINKKEQDFIEKYLDQN